MRAIGKMTVAILVAAPALVYAVNLPPASGNKSLEDRVQHQLRMLPYYSVFDDLNFSVSGDRVTLTGEVTNPVVKTDAENAVKHVAGVTAVDSHIEVLPLSDFDRNIRMRTYFAIYGYGPLQKYGAGVWPSIHILVKNGNVRLVGVVDSATDRNMAYLRANSVPGVFAVTNDLRVQNS